MAWFTLWIKFVSTDSNIYFHFFNALGITCSVIYFVFVEESPKWLIYGAIQQSKLIKDGEN